MRAKMISEQSNLRRTLKLSSSRKCAYCFTIGGTVVNEGGGDLYEDEGECIKIGRSFVTKLGLSFKITT